MSALHRLLRRALLCGGPNLSRRSRRIAVVAFAAICVSSAASAAGRFASLVVDTQNGQVLNELNADLPRYPASLTKMMTLYLTFEALDEGRLSVNQYLWVSQHAASQSPTKLGLRPGQSLLVEDAILGLVTKSANDAAAAIAENLGGSEPAFAARMTARARALGMSRTVFRNASGLPDPDQVTTARDMATLAMALLYHFPHHYHYFSTQTFFYRGRGIPNHNQLIRTYDGADGFKTGYTRASGYNLVASAQRQGRRIIGVVLGAPSSASRNAVMADLFDQSFRGDPVVQVADIGGVLSVPETPALSSTYESAARVAPVASASASRSSPSKARAVRIARAGDCSASAARKGRCPVTKQIARAGATQAGKRSVAARTPQKAQSSTIVRKGSVKPPAPRAVAAVAPTSKSARPSDRAKPAAKASAPAKQVVLRPAPARAATKDAKLAHR